MAILLTPEDAAKELAISVKHLRFLTNAGRIAYVDISLGDTREYRRYRPEDLAKFAANSLRRNDPLAGVTMNVQELGARPERRSFPEIRAELKAKRAGRPRVPGEDLAAFLQILDAPLQSRRSRRK